MRVGIDTGDVVVSALGNRPGQEMVVVGEVVNRASRIQSAAPPGGVMISADTLRPVRGVFDVRLVPGLRLKGIDAPVDGYLVEGVRERGFREGSSRGIEGVETRTVGRELEMRALQGHFREVAEEGQWQVVTVVGDAGVGKSRLVSDFAVWLDELDEPVWWFGGRAAPAAATLPFALLHDMFATRFGISGNDGPVEVRRKWERGLEQALGPGDETVERAHTIAQWLGFEIGDAATIAGVGDPQTLSGRAATQLGEYLCRLAERAPVVLLLEDLHWADEATLGLIHAAESVLRDSSILVVATSRPTLLEQHPHWGEGLDYHTRISLRSLSRRETRRLLDEILTGADRVPEALGDLVVTASEGNPFYVEELVNWFLESGVIRRDDTGWRVFDDQLETAVVPPTLRSVLQARLDGLSAAERQALQRASVIGRVFWDDAVSSLAAGDPVPGDDVPIGAVLDQLRDRDLVHQRERSSFDNRREFLFKHALLRDVVYESMLRRHRRHYHELAAEWFADLAARSERTDEFAGTIADHFASATNAESAARWYLVAGRQAASVHGLEDARRLLTAGVDHAPTSQPTLRADLLLERETVLDRIGDRAAQQIDLDVLATLEPILAELDPARRLRVMINRCRWLFHHSDYAGQHALAEQAIALAESHGLADLAMEAQLWLGKGLTWEGKHEEARAALDASLAAGRRAGRRSVIAESLRYLAIVAGNVSEFALAAELLDETIAMHIEDGDQQNEATVLVQMATVLYNQGHYAAARERLEQALPILVSTGFRYREAVVVSNLAAIVVQQGELGHGRRLIERGLELCKELEDLEGVATAYNIRAEIERRVGDLDRAEADLRATLATIDKRGFAVVSSDSLVGLALTQTARGLHDEAVASVAEAIQRADEADSPMAVARARLAGGYVDIGRGDLDAATASLGAAGEGAERLALAYLIAEVDAAAARVAWLRGRRDEAIDLAGRVFERLGQPELVGALQPGEIYLSCRDVLAAYDDPRAAAAAAAGRDFVESSAALIDETDLRESFLHRVPSSVALAGPAAP